MQIFHKFPIHRYSFQIARRNKIDVNCLIYNFPMHICWLFCSVRFIYKSYCLAYVIIEVKKFLNLHAIVNMGTKSLLPLCFSLQSRWITITLTISVALQRFLSCQPLSVFVHQPLQTKSYIICWFNQFFLH